MGKFKYEGRNPEGETVKGVVEANIAGDVAHYLKDQGIIPVEINELYQRKHSIFLHTLTHRIGINNVPLQDLVIFSRQMATLIGAGVPLIKAIQQVALTSRSKALAASLKRVADGMVGGQSLGKALSEHPFIFSELFVSIVGIGEDTGHLQQAFTQLTTYLEKRDKNRKQFKSAMRYPMIVVGSALVVMLIMAVFVVPVFADMFSRSGAVLPLPTRILMFISDSILNHGFILLGIAFVLYLLLRYLVTLPVIRLALDRTKLRIPIFGKLDLFISVAQFCWTFSLVLQSGISMVDGISLVSNTIENSYSRRRILGMKDQVEQGHSLTEAARNSHFFPLQALQIIEIGEEAGSLDNLLLEIAKYYEEEVDYDMGRMSELLQPIILFILGGMVLWLLLSLYLPMWQSLSLMT